MSHPRRRALPHTLRILELLRQLESGQPAQVLALAQKLRVSHWRIRRDLVVLRAQGCLIDAIDGWVRMVDDHTSIVESDAPTRGEATETTSRSTRRRRRAA